MEWKISGKKWEHPTTGEIRYYIDVVDAAKYGGLEIDCYNTGNIAYASIDGEKISNSRASRILNSIEKVWYTEDKQIHYKGFRGRPEDEVFWTETKMRIENCLNGAE